ncbi:asparagine synthase-related protein [Sphingomonas mesophila]|uniref:asparagine synthase-related protein n=1 Tax=Sphingomonas mesophila TaxID=2303576 RepID=UPI000E574794|nr:asparagine synthase-related protein [Sphingomonas mesophila]
MALTAIAGFVGPRLGDYGPESRCAAATRGLRTFGAVCTSRELEDASFGSAGPPTGGNGSLAVADGAGLLVALDGRIDNLGEVQRSIGIEGSASASVTLARAWLNYRDELLDRLVGEYAIAIYDSRKRELWLARDPSGYRPLHYAGLGGGVGFATMPSGILAMDRRSPDLTRLALYACGGPLKSEDSFWESIFQVPSGSVICFQYGNAERSRDLLAFPDKADLDWPELAEGLRKRIDTAVDRSIASAGPLVGGHLSSGFDSSAIVAVAASRLRPDQRLIAFTAAPAEGARLLIPRGRNGDESALACQTARMAGVEHVIIRSRARLLPSIRGLAHYFERPAPAQFSFPWWREISDSLAQRGARVVLTAGQGNATISYGGLGALGEYLRRGQLLSWYQEARQVRRNEPVRRRGVLFNSSEFLLPDGISSWLLDKANGINLASHNFVRTEWNSAARALASGRREELPPRLALIRGFDAGMRNRGMYALTGIEERDPTIDRELMDFAFSMPPEAHLRAGRYKPLLREILKEQVPAAVLNNRLRGASGADWYELINPQDCRDAIDEMRQSPSASELFDLPEIERAVDNWPEFDPAQAAKLGGFGRRISRALSIGLFLAETDRYPLGRART